MLRRATSGATADIGNIDAQGVYWIQKYSNRLMSKDNNNNNNNNNLTATTTTTTALGTVRQKCAVSLTPIGYSDIDKYSGCTTPSITAPLKNRCPPLTLLLPYKLSSRFSQYVP